MQEHDLSFALDVANNLKHLSRKISSPQDFIKLAFNFEYRGVKIKPQQSKKEISILLSFLQSRKVKSILEIGTSEGGTLFLLSRVASEDAKIVSIDLLEGIGGGHLYPKWKSALYSSFARKTQEMKLLRANSYDRATFDKVSSIFENEKIDFVFIDGDHSYEGVRKDFELYYPLVADDGIIAFHDINETIWENIGVQRYWKEIKQKYTTIEIVEKETDDGLGIGLLVKNGNIYKKHFVDLFVRILQMKNERIERLSNNPISALLSLYEERKDLQLKFPEVRDNDFIKLMKWAVASLESSNPKKRYVQHKLNRFYDWYKNQINY